MHHFFTFFPESLAHLLVRVDVRAFTMLHTVFPVAVVDSTITPHVRTESLLFIILVFALVPTAVFPEIDAMTVHLAVFPFTLIACLLLFVRQFAATMHKAVKELAFIEVSVLELPFAAGASLALGEVSFIAGAVSSRLDAPTILPIVEEAALVAVFYLSKIVFAGHLALFILCHVLSEVALDGDASGHNLLDTLPVGHTIEEAAAVFIAIRPLDFTDTIRYQLVRSDWISTHMP